MNNSLLNFVQAFQIHPVEVSVCNEPIQHWYRGITVYYPVQTLLLYPLTTLCFTYSFSLTLSFRSSPQNYQWQVFPHPILSRPFSSLCLSDNLRLLPFLSHTLGKLKEIVVKGCNERSIKIRQDKATAWSVEAPLLKPLSAEGLLQELLCYFLSHWSYRISSRKIHSVTILYDRLSLFLCPVINVIR